MATEALSISDIETYYGDSHVLHGVGFALQPGRLLGLLGRNGAGKTTCMATIMGFLRPRRGVITLVKNVVSTYVDRWNTLLGAIFVIVIMFMPFGIVPGVRQLWMRWRGPKTAPAKPERAA